MVFRFSLCQGKERVQSHVGRRKPQRGEKGEIFSQRGLPRGKNCAKIIKPFREAAQKAPGGTTEYPGVAQLVARLTGGQEAVSSSLATRTRRGTMKFVPLFLFAAEQNSRPPFQSAVWRGDAAQRRPPREFKSRHSDQKSLKSCDFKDFLPFGPIQRSCPKPGPSWLAVSGLAACCRLVPGGCGEFFRNRESPPSAGGPGK